MAKAPVERTFSVAGFEDVAAGIVAWPMSVIGSGTDTDRIIALADVILNKWREYAMKRHLSMPTPITSLITQLLPLPERGDRFELGIVVTQFFFLV